MWVHCVCINEKLEVIELFYFGIKSSVWSVIVLENERCRFLLVQTLLTNNGIFCRKCCEFLFFFNTSSMSYFFGKRYFMGKIAFTSYLCWHMVLKLLIGCPRKYRIWEMYVTEIVLQTLEWWPCMQLWNPLWLPTKKHSFYLNYIFLLSLSR